LPSVPKLNDHLSALTELLDFSGKLQPLPLNSAIVLELRSDPGGAYYVQAFSKTNPVSTPTELVPKAIGKCNGKLLCPIFDVRLAIADRLVPDLDQACQLPQTTTPPPVTTTMATSTNQSTTTAEATSKTALSVNCPELPASKQPRFMPLI